MRFVNSWFFMNRCPVGPIFSPNVFLEFGCNFSGALMNFDSLSGVWNVESEKKSLWLPYVLTNFAYVRLGYSSTFCNPKHFPCFKPRKWASVKLWFFTFGGLKQEKCFNPWKEFTFHLSYSEISQRNGNQIRKQFYVVTLGPMGYVPIYEKITEFENLMIESLQC